MSNESQMKRAEELERGFYQQLKGYGKIDWLAEYRKWLDRNQIPAEVDGWPSEEAYDPQNVGRFIQYQLMVD